MIKKTVRAFAAAALALLPLTTATTAAHAAETLSLHDGIEALPPAAESRDGYERTAFKHWIDEDKDGCN
ncbi:HNH endonuclease, partial [Streptomyces lydicus]